MHINGSHRRKPINLGIPSVDTRSKPRLQSINTDTYKKLIRCNSLQTLIPCLGDNILEHIHAVKDITECLLNDKPPPIGYGRNVITLKQYMTDDFYVISDEGIFDSLRTVYLNYFETLSNKRGPLKIKPMYHDVMVEHVEYIIKLTQC